MLYVIKDSNGYYFHNKGKIILYESQNQANRYLKEFIQYAIQRVTKEQGTHATISVPIIIMNNSYIMPIDFEIDEVECGTIYATDI